jgi:hypothetical protein
LSVNSACITSPQARIISGVSPIISAIVTLRAFRFYD